MNTLTALRRVGYDPAAYILPASLAAALIVARHGVIIAVAAVAAAAAVVAISHGRGLLMIMTACLFVESLSVGGDVRVGRLIGGLALLVAALVIATRGWDGLMLNSLGLAVAAMGLWLLMSVLWAQNDAYVYQTLSSFALAFGYMLAFALLVRSHADIVAVFSVLAIGLISFGAIAVISTIGASGDYRAEGLQGDPNYFALYQLFALAPAFALLTYLPREYRLLGYAVLPGAAIVSVGASLSRTAFIILVLLLAALPLLPQPNFFPTRSERSVYFLSIFGASVITIALFYDAIVGRAQSIFEATSPEGDKGAGRLDLWAAAWHGYTERPLLGLGAGNYQAHSLDLLQTTPGVTVEASYVHSDEVVHNAYLETLAEGGILGLAAFVLVLSLTASYLIYARRRAIDAGDTQLARTALALLASLCVAIAFAFFISTQLNKPTWIIVGFALALEVLSRRRIPIGSVASGSHHRGQPPRREAPPASPG